MPSNRATGCYVSTFESGWTLGLEDGERRLRNRQRPGLTEKRDWEEAVRENTFGRPRIALGEDDSEMRRILVDKLPDHGYRVGDPTTRAEAYRFGAGAVLDKPFKLNELCRLARQFAPHDGTGARTLVT